MSFSWLGCDGNISGQLLGPGSASSRSNLGMSQGPPALALTPTPFVSDLFSLTCTFNPMLSSCVRVSSSSAVKVPYTTDLVSTCSTLTDSRTPNISYSVNVVLSSSCIKLPQPMNVR